MTYEEAINEALADGLNVAGDGTFPYAQNVNDRLRATWRGQAILTDFWRATDWMWRRRGDPASITLTAGADTVQLPGDFAEKGKYMTVANAATGLPVSYKDPQAVQMALNYGTNGRRQGRALIYTVEYQYNEDFGDLYYLRMAPRNSADQTFLVGDYLKLPPVWVDDDLEIAVPGQYHRSVILRLLKREFMKTVGDARDIVELQEIQSYIAKAIADEKPIPGTKRAPRYLRSRLRSGA